MNCENTKMNRVQDQWKNCYWELMIGQVLLLMKSALLVFFCAVFSLENLPIWVMNSSNPQWTIVSLQSLSLLHEGHGLMRMSGPLNHVLMHVSHPRMVLQHFATITGGCIGTRWQIRHLNVSPSIFFNPSGILLLSLRANKSIRASLMLPTLFVSVCSWSSCCLLSLGVHSKPSSSDSVVALDLFCMQIVIPPWGLLYNLSQVVLFHSFDFI